MQRPESGIRRTTAGLSRFLEQKKCLNGFGECPVRDGLTSFSGEVSEEAARAGAAMRLKCWPGRVFCKLFGRWWLSSTAELHGQMDVSGWETCVWQTK